MGLRVAVTLAVLCCCLASALAVPADRQQRHHRRRAHQRRRAHLRRGSGGAGYAVQTCTAEQGFYCPKKGGHDCVDRDRRCPSNPQDTACPTEHSCFPYAGGFGVYTVRVDMPGTCLIEKPAKLIGQNYYHEAVLYRGFLYEYGGSYPLGQELDVMDPAYKYAGNAHGYTVRGRTGSSTCTRAEVVAAMLAWTTPRSYKLFSNNCQDFAGYLVGVLKANCVRPRFRRQP